MKIHIPAGAPMMIHTEAQSRACLHTVLVPRSAGVNPSYRVHARKARPQLTQRGTVAGYGAGQRGPRATCHAMRREWQP